MSVILLLPDSFWWVSSLAYLRTWRERNYVRPKRQRMSSDYTTPFPIHCFKRSMEPYEALLLMRHAVIPVARTRMSESTVGIFYYVLLILNPSFHASLENCPAFHSCQPIRIPDDAEDDDVYLVYRVSYCIILFSDLKSSYLNYCGT